MAVVEGTFVLRSDAAAVLDRDIAKAVEAERAYAKLGATMDASMAKGGVSTKGASAAHVDHAAAADAGALAATRAAEKHETAAKRTSKAWTDSGSAMVSTGKVVLGTLLAVGAGSIDMAMKFEASQKLLQTQAGLSEKAVKQSSKAILDMAPAVGQSPKALSEGMYHVVSSMDALLPAAHKTTIELGILREAAKGATIGHSNMTETAYVLSSVMNALGTRSIPEAHKAMAELNAIVGTGDMKMQDLVGAMSTGILPAARTFGVGLHDIGAALAYMTDRGVPAQQAATRLRMSITLLGAPTKMAAGILRDLGLSHVEVTTRTQAMTEALEKSGVKTTDLSRDLRQPDGIFVALEDLKKHMNEAGVSAETQSAVISRAFGGGRMGSTIMSMYNEIEKVKVKYDQQTKVANEFDKDWAETQETLSVKLHKAEAAVESLGIKLGEKLIPYVEKGITDVEKLAKWFEHNESAAKGLAVVVGTVLVASVGALAINVGTKLVKATKEFYEFGKSIAMLPQTIGGKIKGGIGGGAAPSAATDVVASKEAISMSWGIRSLTGPGSEFNPLFVVSSGLGGSGYSAYTPTGTTTTPVGRVAGTASEAPVVAGSTSRLAAARGVLGSVLGGGTSALLAGGMGYFGAQALGSLVPGAAGHAISSASAGAGIGAGVGSLFGAPWLGALAGGGIQTLGRALGAHGSGGDILSGAAGGAALTAPLAAVSGPAAPVVLGLGALAGGAMGAFTGTTGSSSILKGQIGRVEADLKGNKGSEAVEQARLLPSYLGEQQYKSTGAEEKAREGVKAFIERVEKGVATHGGEEAASKWASAFSTGLAHGESPEKAIAGLTRGMKTELDKLGPTGRLSFATSMDMWAKQMAQKEPQLAQPMLEFEHETSERMNALGQHIAVVNGQILTGSTQQWQQIAKAITDPTTVAQSKLAGTFSAMQQEALAALSLMGYSPSVARGILSDLGQGSGGQKLAAEAVKAAQAGSPIQVLAPHGAKGMRVPGAPGPDSVGVYSAGGSLRGVVAPGELLVANRHTEARVDNMLGAFGTSLGREVASETVPHFATGGAISGSSHYEKLIAAADRVSAANYPYRWGGGHEQPAHLEPFDCSGAVSYATQHAGYNVPTTVAQSIGGWGFPAGSGQATIFYKGEPGAHTFMRIGSRYWGTSGFARPGGGAGWFTQAPSSSYLSGFRQVHLPGLSGAGGAAGAGGSIAAPSWSGPGGILGAIGVSLGRGVVGAINAGLAMKANGAGSVGSAGGGNPLEGFTGGGGPSANEALGRRMMLAAGYGAGEWPALKALWTQESGWSDTSVNASSGAYGIPQALGHGHPYALGQAAPQIAWGLNYIKERYGTPAAAEAHERSSNWYSMGGRVPDWGGWHKDGGSFVAKRPTYIGVGEGGEEEVHIRPRGRTVAASSSSGGITIEVNIGTIENHRPGDIAAVIHDEIQKLATEIEHEHQSVPHVSEAGLLR